MRKSCQIGSHDGGVHCKPVTSTKLGMQRRQPLVRGKGRLRRLRLQTVRRRERYACAGCGVSEARNPGALVGVVRGTSREVLCPIVA